MSYEYYPSGVPGADIESGPYAYNQNIHITDGVTNVNGESIRDGLGREISILQNYLSQNKFMSGIPVGTGYFYSIGTEDEPVDNIYIVNAYTFNTETPDTSDVVFPFGWSTTNVSARKAVLGNSVTSCKNFISGYLRGLFFELTSGILTVSGYNDTANNNIIDMVGISGNNILISDTPISYLSGKIMDLKDDIYSRTINLHSSVSGHIKLLNINDGIYSNIRKDDIVFEDNQVIKLNHSFPSGWNPFQYSIPYLSEHQIVFNDSSGHTFGEGDLALLDTNVVTISGATFNNLNWSGALGTIIDWYEIADGGADKKYIYGKEYKDAAYIAQEDWTSGLINIFKYHPSTGLIYSTGIYSPAANFHDMETYKDNLYVSFGDASSGTLYKFDNVNWSVAAHSTTGIYKLTNNGSFLLTSSYNDTSGLLYVFQYDGTNLDEYIEMWDNYLVGEYMNGSLSSGEYTPGALFTKSGEYAEILHDDQQLQLAVKTTPSGYVNVFDPEFISNIYEGGFNIFYRKAIFEDSVYYITDGGTNTFTINKFDSLGPQNYNALQRILSGSIVKGEFTEMETYSNKLYIPMGSGAYNYKIIKNGRILDETLGSNPIESFFKLGKMLFAAVSGKLYLTKNDNYFDILEKNSYRSE